MDKKFIENILSAHLAPLGYKKKGNNWILKNHEITKSVNLQKSSFSNLFYINYSYTINSLPLESLVSHIYNRIASLDLNELNELNLLLDLDSSISIDKRYLGLTDIIVKNLIPEIQAINSENDIYELLKKRSELNNIPFNVKKYFNLI